MPMPTTDTTNTTLTQRGAASAGLLPLLVRFRSVLALALLVVVLSLTTESFWSEQNLQNVLRQISVNLCLSVGMTLVVLTGGIDLSVGSTLALAGAVAAGLAKSGLRLDRFNTLVEFTPAGAMLAGAALEPDFVLTAEPAREGLEWALAVPRAKDGAFVSMRVGFRGKDLAAVEIVDSFGQRSRLDFARFTANAPLAAERFRFVPPAGADVIEQ